MYTYANEKKFLFIIEYMYNYEQHIFARQYFGDWA